MFNCGRTALVTARINPARHFVRLSSSGVIRQQFLDFFVLDHGHSLVPSSSVVPYGDPSLSFVNAGMNQFKPVFLGQAPISYKRAANSQKCIRVGGKHNDLDDVGRDGYHHTFFEMLGSWSFNDYFKAEACSMAWQLLTEVYKIPPQQLFITYFGGDTVLNLPPDDECKEVWRSLGVAQDHLLPFGMKDNFWEMGLVGPCGPCSEIHVNKGNLERQHAKRLVNQGSEDVVEIWNLVFMQYNRISNDVLEKLPARHIDTGMGLERLVAFLQNKKSNYDTDLFLPLINTIHQIAGGEPYGNVYADDTLEGQRDCAYRLLADHSRMMTVALADGAFPDNNHRLRRVIRQAIVTSRKWFNQDASLLLELSRRVADMFNGVYPELGQNLNNVHTLLRFEEDVFRENLSKSGRQWAQVASRHPELSALPEDQRPRLVAALPALEEWARSTDCSQVPGELAFKLYDTHGLQDESLLLLSRLNGWTVDWAGFQRRTAEARQSSLLLSSTQVGKVDFHLSGLELPPTDWECQEGFTRSEDGKYRFHHLCASVLAMIHPNGQLLKEVSAGDRVSIVTDKSFFYVESGGQVGDTGSLISPSGSANITEVRRVGGHIHHVVVVTEGCIRTDQPVEMVLNEEQRLNTMCNHTATHLLQAALKSVLKVTCQKSSHVSPDYLRFDFGLFQSDFDADVLLQAESTVREWIRQCLPVERLNVPLHEAVAMKGITLLPGEIYPDVVSLIRVDRVSLEPCCGTHVRNTADLQDFAILSVKSAGVGSRSLKAVTRSSALQARLRANELDGMLAQLEDRVMKQNSSLAVHEIKEADRQRKELKGYVDDSAIPLASSRELNVRLEKMESLIRATAQKMFAVSMQDQVEQNVKTAKEPFIVLALSVSDDLLDVGGAKLSLIKATRYCPSKPILVLALDGKELVARCAVPQECVKEDFDAKKWCDHFLTSVGGKGSSPKGQDPRLAFNIRIHNIKGDPAELQARILHLAKEYACDHLM